ncbi:hypothetical protein DFH09DRAFT_1320965 [Mycena vulgaris]|nr:hypothetical protein DFH09DRAFT_1320965 [Mycena vulgaris]
MASLEKWSHNGEALRFGDGITCTAYPGVLIESMDFEELAAWLAIRNSTSLHPCPQCLVCKDDLPRLTCVFTERTTKSMSLILARAPAGKTDRNEYLKEYGLHDFEHFLWKFNNSDPYKARNGLASQFNANMANFLCWRDLKHISSPTTIDYSEGQTFLDILKCALPCIVQLLPLNSCLVRVIRVMVKVCMTLGLELTLETRLELLQKFIAEYERICKDVSKTHKKSFKFLKQHFLLHAMSCFKDKDTSRNQNTCVGEGFQQEIAARYGKTNGKDAEHQMSIMDENEETMAHLNMKVNEWWKSQEEDEADPVLASHAPTAHWRLGSVNAYMTSTHLESLNRTNKLYHDFNMRLREHLAENYPNHPVSDEQDILVEPCKLKGTI